MKKIYKLWLTVTCQLFIMSGANAQPAIKITEDPKAKSIYNFDPLNLINDVNANQDPNYKEYQADWSKATFATGTPIQNSTYLIFDLSQEETVSSVGISFNWECCVKYYFGVEVAGIDSVYSTVLNNGSSTPSGYSNFVAPMEYFPFAPTKARYVKLVMKGTSFTSETSPTKASMNLMEVRIVSDKRPEYPYIRVIDRVDVVRGSDTNLEGLLVADMKEANFKREEVIYSFIEATNGFIMKGNDTVRSGGTFSQKDINDSLVKFKHNNSNTSSAQFSFTVKTLGGIVSSDTITKRIKVYPKGSTIVTKSTYAFDADPYKSIDGQKSTEWYFNADDPKTNPGSILYDLGDINNLASLSISFSNVGMMSYQFTIGTSSDGTKFNDSTFESELNIPTQTFSFNNVQAARFVKITFNSNSRDTNFFAVKEVVFNKSVLPINTSRALSRTRGYTYKISSSSSALVLEGEESGQVFLSVISSLGTEVYNTSYYKTNGTVSKDVPLDNLSSGIYYVRCMLNNAYLTERILVE